MKSCIWFNLKKLVLYIVLQIHHPSCNFGIQRDPLFQFCCLSGKTDCPYWDIFSELEEAS